MRRNQVWLSVAVAAILAGSGALNASAETVTFEPGPEVQTQVQEAFILSPPGTVFLFKAGKYTFDQSLSLDVADCTIRGEGMDKSVLTFQSQDAGAEGLYVTSDNVTLEDFAIEDTKGNAFKSNGADNLIIRRIRAEWTGGPKETNGAYGLYPVSATNTLIEDCIVRGASDAGIYVGQTKNVIVRRNLVEFNVAGIEIENCHDADVFDNIATRNTGGILVFDMPGLPMKDGQRSRVFRNKIYDNDTVNFAPAGNIVGTVPTGTGVIVMANYNVEIFDNDIYNNQTANVILTSWLSGGQPITDPEYNPFSEGIYVHSNRFGKGGYAPLGVSGEHMAKHAGVPLPDIIWDGSYDPTKLVDGKIAEERRIVIKDNKKTGDGEVTFANLGGAEAFLTLNQAAIQRDLGAHDGKVKPLPPVKLAERK
ncbi:MAG: right-handed parallel beta-helix repeat-containing protein [Candidatus Hydrogenedentes bacterium]|nr:right-handed parallel beta-helix repeat-containing protein [Candidatus Hydrogenedentota bacterium]